LFLRCLNRTKKGIGYFNAVKSIVDTCDGSTARHFFLASPTRSYSPAEAVSRVIGRSFYDLLPFSEEAHTKLCDGDLFSKYMSRYAVPVVRCAGLVREATENE
jgi:hypothetical protein